MALNLFKKNKTKKDKEVKKDIQPTGEVLNTNTETKGNWSASGQQVLKGFYVSEKASILSAMNQYVFKVFNSANKTEVKKQIEKIFDVKVRAVKISNMPPKRRDTGKYPGFKSGFKKAIVILEKGYSIDQAK